MSTFLTKRNSKWAFVLSLALILVMGIGSAFNYCAAKASNSVSVVQKSQGSTSSHASCHSEVSTDVTELKSTVTSPKSQSSGLECCCEEKPLVLSKDSILPKTEDSGRNSLVFAAVATEAAYPSFDRSASSYSRNVLHHRHGGSSPPLYLKNNSFLI